MEIKKKGEEKCNKRRKVEKRDGTGQGGKEGGREGREGSKLKMEKSPFNAGAMAEVDEKIPRVTV